MANNIKKTRLHMNKMPQKIRSSKVFLFRLRNPNPIPVFKLIHRILFYRNTFPFTINQLWLILYLSNFNLSFISLYLYSTYSPHSLTLTDCLWSRKLRAWNELRWETREKRGLENCCCYKRVWFLVIDSV